MDKHAMKRSGNMDGKRVFSFADRKNLIDLSAHFSGYMSEHHPEIRQLRDIQTDHIQGFLDAKAETVSQATLQQYESRFRKLELQINDTYKSAKVDFHSIVTPCSKVNGGGKIRNQMLAPAHFDQLVSTTSNPSLRAGLILSREFGLRAAEIAKLKTSDITMPSDGKAGEIRIVDSKGKRSRILPIQPSQAATVEKALANASGGRVVDCQTGSLQKAFRRELERSGLAESYPNGSYHMTRKLFATERYQALRSSGCSVKQALDRVSRDLGHGANREQLMKEYICCSLN
jgi:integrase